MLLTVLGVLMLSSVADAAEIHFSTAASLREVISELSATFARMHPGVVFIKNFGASGSLAKQIENGAPADIFISANLEWMEYLKNRKLVDDKSIGAFAHNELVFAGRPDLTVRGMPDLLKLDRIAIGSPKSVPAGEYAMDAIRKAGIDKQLEKKLVMARDVRECLMYAERGEVDGSFVYKTDALQGGKNALLLFTIPRNLYAKVTYPMALTVSGSAKSDAVAFFRFLQSAEARRVLAKHGFPLQ
jgi:molybdate transport system substrate-binding protein